jgi:ubiquinone/menaquinone biosynthesis C-methylase UbiE
MQNNEKLRMLDTYFNLMATNGSAYVFNIASKMQFFTPFAKQENISAKELSTVLKYQEQPVELILNTLVSMKVLEKNDGLYNLAPVTKFLTGNYENLSSDYWEHLPTLLIEGTPYKQMDSIKDSETEYKTQVKSLEWMMTPSSMYVANIISEKMNKDSLKILDIGAGSGVWSYSFLQNNKNSSAHLADWPAVLEVAKDSASKKGISDRVKYIEGNYHETEFGENYDLAILGNVTHIETKEGNIELFKKAARSLKSGGQLLILDVFGENPKGEISKWLYQLGLSIRTNEGKVHSPDELKEWLTDHSFDDFTFTSLDITPYTMGLLTATKK